MRSGQSGGGAGERALAGRVALVAGATRGAGRGIAAALGEAGATVYCTGRTTRAQRSEMGRPETIEETAELVSKAGGVGIAVQVDHLEAEQVRALVARIDRDHGRLDVLVNDVWGGDPLAEWSRPVWEHSLDKGLRLLRLAVDLVLADELAPHHATALSLTPGWLRSEAMLDHYGVSEANWRDATEREPHFCISETPIYVGRAVASLAADPDRHRWNGESLSSGQLAKTYGFTDLDGTQPDCWRYLIEVQDPGRPADDTGYR